MDNQITLKELVLNKAPLSKESVLDKAGATREAGARVIAQAMYATKTIFNKDGESYTEPDFTIRLRAEELRAKYTGDIKPDGAISQTFNTVMMVSSDEMRGYIEEARRLRTINTKQQTGEIIDIARCAE